MKKLKSYLKTKLFPEIKVDEILKGVKVDGVELTPDANRMVNIPVMDWSKCLD